MKKQIKKGFLGVSVFTLAIVGTFAFSPVANNYYHELEGNPESECKQISVDCDNFTTKQCKVIAPEGIRSVWQDSNCSIQVNNSGDEPLLPND
tara:strand:+ start:121 stop:399 length:279 start_codon:yes stop_codon:yes gene_type:complete